MVYVSCDYFLGIRVYNNIYNNGEHLCSAFQHIMCSKRFDTFLSLQNKSNFILGISFFLSQLSKNKDNNVNKTLLGRI